MKTIYDFSEQERIAFMEVYSKFKVKENETKHLHITYNNSTSSFDCFIHVYNQDGNKVSSSIIEIKVRNTHYTDLLIENYKYNKLRRLEKIEKQNFDKVNLYYLVFTTAGTYLFNLNTVPQIDWQNDSMPATTFQADKNIIKKVGYLNIQDAINFNYIFDPSTVDNNKVKKQFIQQKIDRCIFNSIQKLK